MKLVRIVQTCCACPSQWDAWDEEGNYYYLRYRFGHGTVDKGSVRGELIASFTYGNDLDGSMRIEQFLELAGLEREDES